MKILPLLLCVALAGASCIAPVAGTHHARPAEKSNSLKVIPLQYADAMEVARSLSNMVKDVRLVADARTNSIVVSYQNEDSLAQVERTIAQLDVEVHAKAK